jgi:hypothetical protein
MQNLHKLLSDVSVIKLVDELAGDAEKLAVDCLLLHVAELVFEEGGEELEDVGEGLWVRRDWIEF